MIGRGKKNVGRGLLAVASVLVVAMAAVAIAGAAQSGNLEVRFHGNIAPRKLPRKGNAPVGVLMSAKIDTKDGTPPPRLAEIRLEINKNGVLDSKGLPTCALGKLHNTSDAQAKKACGPAEVGHGNVTARVKLREQEEFAVSGPLLAFNARYKGKPAIFAHVTGKGKLSITYVIIFQIEKAKTKKFGTALVAEVPSIASGSGHISAFSLSLKRNFSTGGKQHSFVSAGCPLPPEVNIGEFSFAKSTFAFEGGTTVSEEQSSTCKAKG